MALEPPAPGVFRPPRTTLTVAKRAAGSDASVRWPRRRGATIIVISAKELTDEETKTLEERVNFVMKKQGFDGEKLMQEINGVLGK